MLFEYRVVSDGLGLFAYLVVGLPVRKMKNGWKEIFSVDKNMFSEVFFNVSVEMSGKVIRFGCGINGRGVIAEWGTLHGSKNLFGARSVW